MSTSIKVTAKLKGEEDVKRAIAKVVEAYDDDPKVTVGYGTDYALAVHERVEVFHKVGGPKFLESALNEAKRGYAEDLARRARRHRQAGNPEALADAIMEKALQVEAASVKRVPVATGRLRASHFTAKGVVK